MTTIALDDLAPAFYMAALFAPFTMPGLAALSVFLLAVRIRRHGWGEAWYAPDLVPCGLLVLLASATAFGAYGYGVGRGFYLLDPDQKCAAMGLRGDDIVTHLALPVGAECVTDNGVATELVPSWVNPLVYVSLAAAAVAATAWVAAWLRRAEEEGEEEWGPDAEPEGVSGADWQDS
ncbi:hypothetical protein [Streptomyces sp. NPDC048242]|uniref:hypothetical protein n=1 Tax=Streptomyces sp. NPDC048242 TaxID=3155026 RepID=UPI003446D5ED